MMENLFNVLCSSLMATINRDRFLRGEGLQLMNLMLREKKMSRNGSLKVRLCAICVMLKFKLINYYFIVILGIRLCYERSGWKRQL